MQLLLTQLLNLPGIEVESYRDCGGQWILEVEAITTQAIFNYLGWPTSKQGLYSGVSSE